MAVIGAAEELGVPVVIQHAEVHEEIMPIEIIGPIMLELAGRAKVPVCVHLDHGETLEYVCKALNIGFTSVMYDGSVQPFEVNMFHLLHRQGPLWRQRSAAWENGKPEQGQLETGRIQRRFIQIRSRQSSLWRRRG